MLIPRAAAAVNASDAFCAACYRDDKANVEGMLGTHNIKALALLQKGIPYYK